MGLGCDGCVVFVFIATYLATLFRFFSCSWLCLDIA